MKKIVNPNYYVYFIFFGIGIGFKKSALHSKRLKLKGVERRVCASMTWSAVCVKLFL